MSAGEIPPPPQAAEPAIAHRGRVYGLGDDGASFGVWPLAGGPPVETFERTEEGWRRAWVRFQRLDRRDSVRRWRQRTATWILLNVLVAIVVWVAIIFVEGVVLALAGRNVDEVSDTATIGLLIGFPLVIAGWLLFAYASSRARRGLALFLLVGGAIALAIVTGLVGQPAD